jgi:Transglutaminase-like superfamily/Coenzyme PQQ synthesis protein D (PqqD)
MIQTIISAETTVRSTSQPEYVLAPHVVLVLVRDGTGRLLDMSGTFYALSATAAAMLDETLRVGPEAGAPGLAALYQVEEQRVRGDLRRFLDTLEQKGLIRRRGHVPRGREDRRGLASLLLVPALRGIHYWPVSVGRKAKALLGLAYLSLRLFSLPHTIAAWQQYHRHSQPTIGHGDRETAAREVDTAVRSGAAYHFVNTECKERALCCWSLLRAQGFPAQLVFGIDLYPFTGHCWCQLDGQILTDYADRCERFTPVLSYT